MAVSSSSDFTITKRQLIERSLRMVNAIKSGQSADENMVRDASIALNSILRELDAERVGLWTMKEASFSSVAGQISYTTSSIPTDIFQLEHAWVVVSNNDERPLDLIGYGTYDKLGDKNFTGEPEKVLISDEADTTQKTIKLWPKPSSARTIKLRYRRRAYDFDANNDNPDFPAEWFSCLSYLLAAELSEEYVVDQGKIDRLFTIGDRKLQKLKAKSTKRVDNSTDKPTRYY
jgi:hypothetical protein